MAENSKIKSKGLFNRLKNKVSLTPPLPPPIEEEVIESFQKVSKLLLNILEGNFPVRVLFDNSSFAYYSHFEWELFEDDDGILSDTKAHMEQGRYLLMAALDPPIGNIKIRTASEIKLEFFTQRQLLSCMVSLIEITKSRKLLLSYPEVLYQRPQKRSAFRAPVDHDMDVVISVIRPSGIVFEAKISDLSTGGTAFYPIDSTPKISNNSKIRMTIIYPEGRVELHALMLGIFFKGGESNYRTQFMVDNHKTAADLEALVAYVQREKLQKRRDVFRE